MRNLSAPLSGIIAAALLVTLRIMGIGDPHAIGSALLLGVGLLYVALSLTSERQNLWALLMATINIAAGILLINLPLASYAWLCLQAGISALWISSQFRGAHLLPSIIFGINVGAISVLWINL